MRRQETVQFALVEPPRRGLARVSESEPAALIEITLVGGERIRLGAGADAPTVRVVLSALRAAV